MIVNWASGQQLRRSGINNERANGATSISQVTQVQPNSHARPASTACFTEGARHLLANWPKAYRSIVGKIDTSKTRRNKFRPENRSCR